MKTRKIIKYSIMAIVTIIAAIYWKPLLHALVWLAVGLWILRLALKIAFRLWPLFITGGIVYYLLTV